MNKDRKDKGGKNVEIAEIESPIIETQPQNGNSDSDEWKTALEREKLQVEIEKLQADKRKTELDIRDLDKPFYARKDWLQVVIPSLITILSTAATIGITTYLYSFKKLENDYSDAKNQLINANKELGNVQNQTNTLKDEIANANSEKQQLIKENEKSHNDIEDKRKELDAKQKEIDGVATKLNAVNNQLASAERQRKADQEQVRNLKIEQSNLLKQIEPLRAQKVQIEKDLIKSQYASIKDKLLNREPNYNTVNLPEISNIKNSLARDAGYKQNFEAFLLSENQDSREKPFVLMLGFITQDKPELKNQLTDFIGNYIAQKGDDDSRDLEMLMILAACFSDTYQNDVSQFIYWFVKFVKNYDVDSRRFYINRFESRLRNPYLTQFLDKDVLLDLIEIIRDDIYKGYKYGEAGNSDEILLQCNLVAYISIAGNILAFAPDSALRGKMYDRMAVVGWWSELGLGLPGSFGRLDWQKWICKHNKIVELWNEVPTLKTLRQSEQSFKEAIDINSLKKIENNNCS
jgi:predicted  nucleic acid-binding Zn-ribbon protein